MSNSKKYLYLDGVLMDIGSKTRIAMTDNSQPLTSLFQIKSAKSNTFLLPFTDSNDKFFNDMKLPHTDNLLKFKKYNVIYIQDEVELIPRGIGIINDITKDGYQLVVASNEADLYDSMNLNADGTPKMISDLDFSDLDFVLSHTNRMEIFDTQLDDKNDRAFFLPLIDYQREQVAPVLQRNLNFEGVQGINSWLQTFLAWKPGTFPGIESRRSSSRYLFPAVKVHEIVKRIIEQNNYNLQIPANLRTEWAVIPFSNENILLKDDFIEDRTVVLGLTTDATITHGSNTTSIITFNDIEDPDSLYDNTTGYQMKTLAGVSRIILMALEVEIELMYYFKETGSSPHVFKIGWRDANTPFGIDYVEEYDLIETFIEGTDADTASNFDYRGSPRVIKVKLDIDNFAYNFEDDNLFDRRLIFRTQFHGQLIISASKTKITIKPKKQQKIMRNAVWSISENLPAIRQTDFLRAFLQINGLEIKQDEETQDIVFTPLSDTLSTGLANAIDMTKNLCVDKDYKIKTIGNTSPKNNVFSYKQDNTVVEPKDFTVVVGDVQTGKNSQSVFVLPFAASDDILPSKGMGLYDFSDSIITASLPMCDDRGFIESKIEPRILLLNFFENYGDPGKGDEVGLNYEPPLFIRAGLPQELDPEDPNLRPYGTLYDDLVTATFTNTNTIKYQFPEEDVKTLKIQIVVQQAYSEYTAILPQTAVYEAFFAISAEDYRKLSKNRIIKITKGELEGYWYVNKKENFVSAEEKTKFELQKI